MKDNITTQDIKDIIDKEITANELLTFDKYRYNLGLKYIRSEVNKLER